MKWTNKGHEFDGFPGYLEGKQTLYIYGAGRNGELLYKALKSHPWPAWEVFFVDRCEALQASGKCGLPVLPPAALRDADKAASFVAVTPDDAPGLAEELEQMGFVQGTSLLGRYDLLKYLSVQTLRRTGALCLYELTVTMTDLCSLRCRDCSYNTPYKTMLTHRPLQELQADIDLLFRSVDRVNVLNLVGGEPFLQPDLLPFLQYILQNYGTQLDDLHFTSNLFAPISDELLAFMRENDIMVYFSDYRATLGNPRIVGKINEQLGRLEANGVRVLPLVRDSWVDFGFREGTAFHTGDDALRAFFDACNPVQCRAYRDGKLALCMMAQQNQVFLPPDTANACPIDAGGPLRKQMLLEYYWGYTDQGYIGSCRYCRGLCNNTHCIPVAVQLEKGASL